MIKKKENMRVKKMKREDIKKKKNKRVKKMKGEDD